jgi:hypothetical protein
MFGPTPAALAIPKVNQMNANAAMRYSHNPSHNEATHKNVLVRGLLDHLTRIADGMKLMASTKRTTKTVTLAVEFVMSKNRTIVKKRR